MWPLKYVEWCPQNVSFDSKLIFFGLNGLVKNVLSKVMKNLHINFACDSECVRCGWSFVRHHFHRDRFWCGFEILNHHKMFKRWLILTIKTADYLLSMRCHKRHKNDENVFGCSWADVHVVVYTHYKRTKGVCIFIILFTDTDDIIIIIIAVECVVSFLCSASYCHHCSTVETENWDICTHLQRENIYNNEGEHVKHLALDNKLRHIIIFRQLSETLSRLLAFYTHRKYACWFHYMRSGNFPHFIFIIWFFFLLFLFFCPLFFSHSSFVNVYFVWWRPSVDFYFIPFIYILLWIYVYENVLCPRIMMLPRMSIWFDSTPLPFSMSAAFWLSCHAYQIGSLQLPHRKKEEN